MKGDRYFNYAGCEVWDPRSLDPSGCNIFRMDVVSRLEDAREAVEETLIRRYADCESNDGELNAFVGGELRRWSGEVPKGRNKPKGRSADELLMLVNSHKYASTAIDVLRQLQVDVAPTYRDAIELLAHACLEFARCNAVVDEQFWFKFQDGRRKAKGGESTSCLSAEGWSKVEAEGMRLVKHERLTIRKASISLHSQLTTNTFSGFQVTPQTAIPSANTIRGRLSSLMNAERPSH